MTRRADAYRSCAAQGMTIAEAAAHMGVTAGAAESAARRYGIKFARQRGLVSQWQALASRGLTAAEAAREMGRSIHAARYMSWVNGVKFRSDNSARTPKPDLPQPQRIKVPLKVSRVEAERIMREMAGRK